VAILVVIYDSTDRSEQGGLLPAIKRMRDGKTDGLLTARRIDGLKWAVPKTDKLQTLTGAQTTRFVIHDTQKVRKSNREYIYAKPYVRIVSRLAPVPPDYADVVPPFNPFKLYATERQAEARAGNGDGPATDVAVKVVELLGGILPGEDGLELDAQDVSEIVARSGETLASTPDTSAADLQAGAAGSGLAAIKEDGQKRRLAEEPALVNTTSVAKSRSDSKPAHAGDLERKQVRVVKAGRADSLHKILQQSGADIWTAKAMAEAAKQVVPDATLQAGQEVRITMVPSLTVAGRLEPARFSIFTDGHDHKVTVSRNSAGDFVASATPFDESAAVRVSDGEAAQLSSLYGSFYAACLMQNVPPETIQQMLRVHAYETDFRRRVRAGDTVEMFFDSREDTGAENAPGELLFTAITSSGQSGRFWRYRTPDGVVDYFDENGNNAKRFLLRKPLRSDDVRLTSGFGMRFHPLFNERRMHQGIDWSGPIGTPIVAAGSGTVEEALYKGGHGKYVRLQHANGYQTTYSHMSGFARGIEPGAKVRQGQIIGFLGNTGYSTGPHLHFEILVNSRFVDPLSIQVPRERQLAGKQLADFFKEKARIDDLMRRPPVSMQSK
jgi:murein DD-endopeptidase MepM/ murein hydrolase activator NlpD